MSLITYLQRNFTTHQAPTTTPRDSAESRIKVDSSTSLAKSSNIQRIHILYSKPNISKIQINIYIYMFTSLKLHSRLITCGCLTNQQNTSIYIRLSYNQELLRHVERNQIRLQVNASMLQSAIGMHQA